MEPGHPDYKPKNDLDSVIKYILTVPWDEYEDFMFRQVIILVCTSRFNDMEAITILLSAIKDHGHRNFVVSVLDHFFEQLIRGIEENDFKNAQRRICSMKFISECYNYKLIHSDTLFCLLYKLINIDVQSDTTDEKFA